MSELFQYEKDIHTRWISGENPLGEKGKAGMEKGGRKGRPTIGIPAHGSYVIAQAEGPGILRRIWFTSSIFDKVELLSGVRLQCFWDHCDKPAVSVPVGDFFMHMEGQVSAIDSALIGSGEGRSFVSYIPMPFRTAMKVELVNDSDIPIGIVFDTDFTLGDSLPDNMLYFHAVYNRTPKTIAKQDYEILPRIHGKGRYVGSAVTVRPNPQLPGWWGEGEVKVYLDGDTEYPTLCGTGAEDYIGNAYGMHTFINWYQGCTRCTEKEIQFYRYHIADPLYFHSDIRITIQQIGMVWGPEVREAVRHLELTKLDGERFDPDNDPDTCYERFDDDYSSVAYFYLDTPYNDAPIISDITQRMP